MAPFLWEGEWAGSPSSTMWPGWGLPPYQVASWAIQPFGHNRHRPKIGRLCSLFWEGELGPHLTQCCLGKGLPPYKVASWSIQPFGHNRYGPKIWGLCPFGGGAGSPANTIWPGPRPTSLPRFILIHPTVWPQYTNVTDRQQDRRDRQTDRTGQRSDSIGRTVLQTVVQKWEYYFRTVSLHQNILIVSCAMVLSDFDMRRLRRTLTYLRPTYLCLQLAL